MFNKYLVTFPISMLLLSSSVNATQTENVESTLNALITCMQTITFDEKTLEKEGSQQMALLSVLNNITQDNSTAVENLKSDYSDVYEQVESQCADEIEAIKTLSL